MHDAMERSVIAMTRSAHSRSIRDEFAKVGQFRNEVVRSPSPEIIFDVLGYGVRIVDERLGIDDAAHETPLALCASRQSATDEFRLERPFASQHPPFLDILHAPSNRGATFFRS
jgi:hypothetical protein